MFKDGDKVFAKIKGYPPWPAKIVKRMDKKFEVQFYGTNEIGHVKTEDICNYIENRATILKKATNRKGYAEGIEEIEEALLAEDGIELEDDVSLKKFHKKSKRSESPDGDEPEKPAETPKERKKPGPKSKTQPAVNTLDSFVVKATNAKDAEHVSGKIDIISADYLRHIIDFAKKVKQREGHYKKKTVKTPQNPLTKVLAAKLPSGRFVGIKYKPVPGDNEYIDALNEEEEAKRALELLENIQNGSVQPEDNSENIISDLNKDEKEIKDIIISKINDRKREVYKWLDHETKLIKLDTKIRVALNMYNADPEQALEHLKKLHSLDVQPLMLKKHSNLFETVKRLRKYIGNVAEWQLNPTEESKFQEGAEEIRQFAVTVYLKFMKVFGVEDKEVFEEVFEKEVLAFKENCKDFTEEDVYGLCSEPDSKQAYLDVHLDDIDVGKVDKENDNAQVANGTVD